MAKAKAGKAALKRGHKSSKRPASSVRPLANGIAHVQDSRPGTASGQTSVTTSFLANVTAGNLVVVMTTNAGMNSAVVSVSDSKGNTYSPAAVNANGFNHAEIWFAKNVVAGTPLDVVVHLNGSATVNAIATEVSGMTNVAVDSAAHRSDQSTDPTPSSINTSVANAIVFVLELNFQFSFVNAPDDFTPIYNDVAFNGSECAYNILTAQENGLEPEWDTINNRYTACIAAFKSQAYIAA